MDNKAGKNKNSLNIFLNKYFNLILSLILVAILIVSFFLVIMPKYQSARLLIQDNIENKRMLYAQQKKKYDTLVLIDTMYKSISASDLNRFNSVLPAAYNKEKLFGEFEEIINKGGWVLLSVSIDSGGEDKMLPAGNAETKGYSYGTLNPNVGAISVTLNLKGVDYMGAKRLLQVIEENLKLFDVTNITISNDSAASISLITYYYKQAN